MLWIVHQHARRRDAERMRLRHVGCKSSQWRPHGWDTRVLSNIDHIGIGSCAEQALRIRSDLCRRRFEGARIEGGPSPKLTPPETTKYQIRHRTAVGILLLAAVARRPQSERWGPLYRQPQRQPVDLSVAKCRRQVLRQQGLRAPLVGCRPSSGSIGSR